MSVLGEQEHPPGLGDVPSSSHGTARPQGPPRRVPPCGAKEKQNLSELRPRKVLTGTFTPFGTRGRKSPGKEPSAVKGLPSLAAVEPRAVLGSVP